MIQPHLNYCILVWGLNSERLSELQKIALRLICLTKYNAPCDHLFKTLKIFKIPDLLRLQELTFYYKHVHNNLPQYLQQMPLIPNNEIHNHDTRRHNDIHIYATQHAFAKRCIRYNIPKTVNEASAIIKEKVAAHSLHGFTTYIKIHLDVNSCQSTIRKLMYTFACRLDASSNGIIRGILSSDLWYHSRIRRHWRKCIFSPSFE